MSKPQFSKLFVDHREYFFVNGQSLQKEAQHIVDKFSPKEIDDIATLAGNEAFYTLINLLNARLRIKKDNFEKYPDELWKIIKIISYQDGVSREKEVQL